MDVKAYRCPECYSEFTAEETGLRCTNNHFFSFAAYGEVPVFACEVDDVNEYTTEQAAEIHDNALSWLFRTYGGSEHELRERLIDRLDLQEGQKILVTGVGGGNDLPYIAKQVGVTGSIYAQDFSRQMLLSAEDRAKTIYDLSGVTMEFSVSDAANLPYHDRYFDAAYHFGGINLFSDVGKGIAEMDRVVRSGGRVVFGDEGLAPWLKKTEYGKMVINNNALCDFVIPLHHLPSTARDVKLTWEVGYCFYVIDYTVSDSPLPLDAEVPHIGRRGGSMRTRYLGQLEGVSPELKEQLYTEAQKRGLSRVDFLESLLRKGLEK